MYSVYFILYTVYLICSNDLLIRQNESFICSNDLLICLNESFICLNDILIRANETFICSNDKLIRSNDLLISPDEDFFFIWPLYAAVQSIYNFKNYRA